MTIDYMHLKVSLVKGTIVDDEGNYNKGMSETITHFVHRALDNQLTVTIKNDFESISLEAKKERS